MKFSLKKLQGYIKEPLPSVDVLREKIIFHAFEVESVDDLGNGDYELDIKVLPDRAFDAKDERGMAREIAALFGLNLNEPDQYDRGESFAFSIQKVAALLGRDISESDIRSVFDAYHYHYDIDGDQVTFSIPPWRKDLVNVHDIADEIGRYLGYDTVQAILPNIGKAVEVNPEFAAITAKKNEMVARGYHEVMTYSLVKKGDYQVAKGPKGKDYLRTNLLSELRKAYELNKQNAELLPNHTPRIFEIGRVFLESGEELHVAWIDEKGEGEEVLNLTPDPSPARRGEETLSLQERATREASWVRFIMWSEYPFITRDIAMWVPEGTDAASVAEILENAAGELLVRSPRLFDTFTKDGRTSLAFRLVFQSNERTLTNEEVDGVMVGVTETVKGNNWEVR